MKDGRIRSNTPELNAVKDYGLRSFCLSNQKLLAAVMAERFLRNLDAMVEACKVPGPFIYAVHETRLQLLDLR